NRQGFAKGALLAAEWLKGKTGYFGMNDMLCLDR
ncbi:MAG: dihydrodipicolinate reductase C-terminal domain-containing protein, partial [Bacteroidales bacterium]